MMAPSTVGARSSHTCRLVALLPAGTLSAIVFHVIAGGILMLATWLAAAALALALPTRAAASRTSAEY